LSHWSVLIFSVWIPRSEWAQQLITERFGAANPGLVRLVKDVEGSSTHDSIKLAVHLGETSEHLALLLGLNVDLKEILAHLTLLDREVLSKEEPIFDRQFFILIEFRLRSILRFILQLVFRPHRLNLGLFDILMRELKQGCPLHALATAIHSPKHQELRLFAPVSEVINRQNTVLDSFQKVLALDPAITPAQM
jgi:hypothetical protein